MHSAPPGVAIRGFSDADSINGMTELLHRAYAPLAEMGMQFFASHQTAEQTLDRVRRGECFIAVSNDQIVGTVTLYRTYSREQPEWYRRDDVAYFGQFAVEPALQGRGIGRLLLSHVENVARAAEFVELALDTSEGATHLIAYYRRHGFRFVGHVKWDAVNYRSVIMSKRLV